MKCQRELFSLPEDAIYLNCAYMGPLPKVTQEAGVRGVMRKADPTSLTIDDFFSPVERLRGLVARLVHTQPERVAMIPSVSYGIQLAVNNTPLSEGQNIVVPEEEFPSNVYGWMQKAREAGAEMRFVPRPKDSQTPGSDWSASIIAAMDDNTAVVNMTPVHWTDGTLFDLENIGRRARELGALFLVDGTQSVGARPFDFSTIQPDLLVVADYKWCLGPYTYGFAVVGDRLMKGRPLEESWLNRSGSEDFANLAHYTDQLRPAASRFDMGEHPNFVAVPMLTASLEQILAWGVENIQAHCSELLAHVSRELEGSEFAMTPPGERADHLFGIHFMDMSRVPGIMEALQKRRIFVSVRGNAIRVSPHVYNRPEDLSTLAEALLSTKGV